MRLLSITLLSLLLTSCYVSKSLEDEVRVRINGVIPVTIVNEGNSAFVDAYTKKEYQQKFLEGLKAEFATSKVIIDNENPMFEIKFTSLTITESTEMETVNDSTSDDHGRQFELTKLSLTAKGDLIQLPQGNSSSWWADKTKAERVTSLRSGGQVITGQNKEKNEYREKEFSDDQAADLTIKCGRRSGVVIVKDIIRAVK